MQISIFQKRKLNSCRTDSCPNHKKKGVELAMVHSTSGHVYFLCRPCYQLLHLMEAKVATTIERVGQQMIRLQAHQEVREKNYEAEL